MPELCDCGDKLQPCGGHVETDPHNPCEDCAKIEKEAKDA